MTEDLPFAYMGPPLKGKIRSNLEDFSVEEILHYEASGEGEHLFLHVNKVGINTKDVAKELAVTAETVLMCIRQSSTVWRVVVMADGGAADSV